MKSLLVGLLFLCFTQLAIAQEKPGRQETIEYINKILKKNAGMEYFEPASQYQNVTIKESYLEYNKNDKSYTFYSRDNHYDGKKSGCETETTLSYKNFTFKNFASISDNALPPATYANRVSPVKYIGIAFPAKEVTKDERAQYLYSSECARFSGLMATTQIYEINRPENWIIIPYPTGDPDDLKRLKNAFLRLKELDAELKDPFLD